MGTLLIHLPGFGPVGQDVEALAVKGKQAVLRLGGIGQRALPHPAQQPLALIGLQQQGARQIQAPQATAVLFNHLLVQASQRLAVLFRSIREYKETDIDA